MYGTRVHIREKGGRGELALEFYSGADRDRLLHRLLTAGAASEELEAGLGTAQARER